MSEDACEKLSRLELMFENVDGDWDFSDNDKEALAWAVARLKEPPPCDEESAPKAPNTQMPSASQIAAEMDMASTKVHGVVIIDQMMWNASLRQLRHL